jgi:uncharacterized repeat protein (TIGR03803 family)
MAAGTLLLAITTAAAAAQSFSVIHTFQTNLGAHPYAGVTVDQRGNLYGTTAWGGQFNLGTAYQLRRAQSGFVYNLLHSFFMATDGAYPWDAPTIGPDGTLYATTRLGGIYNHGTIVNLQPPASVCHAISCPWRVTTIHSFRNEEDGGEPVAAIIFDQAGNMYGTALSGGVPGPGVVYEMTRSNGNWVYQVLYSFTGGQDGGTPASPLMFDSAGNLYGTASAGGNSGCGGAGCGTIFRLTNSGSGWTDQTLYTFQNGTDGAQPTAGLVIDGAGNLYGATCCGNANGGAVFLLSPSGGSFAFNLALDLSGSGPGPQNTLVRDRAGNLYGTTWGDGQFGLGTVFKLTPSNGGWIYSSLHDFTGGSDGANPQGGLVMDSNGTLYGTTYNGGASGSCCGVVFQVVP